MNNMQVWKAAMFIDKKKIEIEKRIEDWKTGYNDKKKIEIEKRIERTKKKLFNIIFEYNAEHVDDMWLNNKQKTVAYKLADNLYRKYKSLEKKDGLTLHEIKVLNKFYE